MKSVLLLSVFISSFHAVFTRIELEDFYPYGPENNDTLIPPNDDGSSGLVDIAVRFPFFDKNHRSLYVNTNGAISFLRQVSQFTPDPFPLGDQRRLIAPFWADVDTRRGGFVYYRETEDLSIRTRVSQEIRKYFVRQRAFFAKWAMIVTWLNVAHFRSAVNISVAPDFNSTNNTFQAILATDGLYSFSIFQYNKIEWTFGTLSSGIPAQAGFNAGDGFRYFSIPNSRTPAIINVTSTSNYEVPGMWIFQVDGATVENHGCTSNGGRMVLSPRSGIELGGTKVYIGGPCYTPESRIVCRFNKALETNGSYISPERAYCITPRLYVVGLISVELSLDGGATFNFTGRFRSVPLGRNIPEIRGLRVEQWANSTSTVLTWDQDAFNSLHVDVEIFLFDSFRFRLHDTSLVTFKSVPNTGNYNLGLNKEMIPSIISKRRRKRSNDDESPISIVSIHETATSSPSILDNAVSRIFSEVYLISWLVNIDYCDVWYNRQPNANDIGELQEELPPCPPSLQAIQVDDTFVADTGIKLLLSSFYHPGSKLCFRSRFASSSGAGQQCCYDDSDRLMVGPPGGGSLDIVSPEESFWSHMKRDVLPWYACCALSDKCNKYYQKRPSDDGSRYRPPPTAGINGDPHLVTFDGTLYTFNGYGEYVLLQIKEDINLQFQGRLVPLINERGKKTNATALTAFVVKELGSDIVQVEFNTRLLVDVSINGNLINFDEQSRLDFNGVFIIKQSLSEAGIYFHSGVSIVTKSIEGFLAYEISIPSKYKEKTAGLLGFWDGDKKREFLLPNGSFIHTKSSSRTLHHEFGQKWLVERNNSLFTYKFGKNYSSFLDLHFAPIFMDEVGSPFSNTTLEEEAKNVCGENKECLFDIAMTGKTSIGQATLNSIKELQKRTYDLQIVLEPVYFGCDSIENSGKQMDACAVCGGDNSTCTDCQGNVKPGLVKNGASCDEGDDLKFYLLFVGIPVLVLVLLLLLAFAVVRCRSYFCRAKTYPGPASKDQSQVVTHVNEAYDMEKAGTF